MKTNLIKTLGRLALPALLALWSGGAAAQQKVTDKDLQGVWLMEWFYYEGEDTVICGGNYAQVKVYRPNGEYACAEAVKLKDGTFHILPHEYGTYSYKNGVYSEMGRPATTDALIMTDRNTFRGRWMNRRDLWKKAVGMPEKLTDYIVNVCKANQTPANDIQQLMKKHMFK